MGGVIDVLEAIGAVYAIWGGLAVVAHGEPRFTMDMDVLLSPQGFHQELFAQRLEETHYHVDRTAVQLAVLDGGYFNVIHLYTHIKTDFYVLTDSGESMLQKALTERVRLPFDEMRDAAYVSADGTIVSKLVAYADSESTRHLEDISSIIRSKGHSLDAAYIETVAARLGVLGIWRRVWDENRRA